MARGIQLGELVDQLRAEIGASANPAHNRGHVDRQKHHLRKSQERLWADWYWPHLRIDRYFTLQAGQRLYDCPAGLSIEGVRFLWVRDSGLWTPLGRDIPDSAIDEYDWQQDQRNDPARYWQIAQDDDGDNVIEIWPLPATNGVGGVGDNGQVKVRGQKTLPSLVDDDDIAVLDDYAIVLFAAAKLVGVEERKAKLEEAQAHVGKLRADLNKSTSFTIGSRADRGRWPRGPKSVFPFHIEQP